jgi:hypothetical protein
MYLIGLCGKKSSGKTEVAKILKNVIQISLEFNNYEFQEIAFADKLKEVASDLYDIPLDFFNHPKGKDATNDKWGISPRVIMQKLGTEVSRTIHPMTWIYHVESRVIEYFGSEMYKKLILCVSDIRFLNEAQMVKRYNGSIWKINRPMLCKKDDHQSETELDLIDPEYIINNNGTIGELRINIHRVLKDFFKNKKLLS